MLTANVQSTDSVSCSSATKQQYGAHNEVSIVVFNELTASLSELTGRLAVVGSQSE